ncbi:hypothetical protein BSM4216_2758 [Bacillus smithii]|nr:hypothetical protein BSM4216_2758 [Bacillus smithii]
MLSVKEKGLENEEEWICFCKAIIPPSFQSFFVFFFEIVFLK